MVINYNYFADLTIDDFITQIVIPCVNEDGYPTLIIKNTNESPFTYTTQTDNLVIKTNNVLYRGNKNFYVHTIISKRNDYLSKHQFDVIYKYIFKKIDKPVSGENLRTLLDSIEEYFKITPDKNTANMQIGVFGELIFLNYMEQLGYASIYQKYHSNFFSKHDIEISSSLRIEVKTTLSEKRIHHFKHNQISRNDISVFVASVMLEESKEGLSLFDLINRVIDKTTDPDTQFCLEKLKARCGINEINKGISFSEENALSRIKILNADNLPKLEENIPDSITNVEYDIDCTSIIEENKTNFVILLGR